MIPSRDLNWRLLVVLLTGVLALTAWDAIPQTKPSPPADRKPTPPRDASAPQVKRPTPPVRENPTTPKAVPKKKLDISPATVAAISTMSEALQHFVGFTFQHDAWTAMDSQFVRIIRVTDEIVVLERGFRSGRGVTLNGDLIFVPIGRFHTLELDSIGGLSNRRYEAAKIGVR